MPSANGAVPERSRCSPSHFKAFKAVKYATLPRPLLYVCSDGICGIHFFIGSSDGEILLLCVAEGWMQFRRDKITFLYIVEFARIILGVTEGNFHICQVLQKAVIQASKDKDNCEKCAIVIPGFKHSDMKISFYSLNT